MDIDFKKRVLSTIQECCNQSIAEIDFSIGISQNNTFIKKIEQDAGLVFHQDIHEFYKKLDGFRLSWVLEKNNHKNLEFRNQIWGSIHFYNLEKIFIHNNKKAPWKDILWFDFEHDEKETLQLLRPFDFHNGDITSCGCFKVVDGFVSNEVYYYDLEYGIIKMKMNFLDYVDKVLMYKGFMNWQRAFVGGRKRDVINMNKAVDEFLS
ncbi:hypothetical protein [Aureispira sp. CCB-QB1]|uniref:hypothetical protein n=1 Tax=Aureispira sp. CCB-QB1 TaxID=1313421 RepID=UPI000698BBE0|nr:hypothetical protein [Aureispira sp. CCB-QB1]